MSDASRKFLIVGITGGVASGKSSLCSLLAERGALVVDLDNVSREVTSTGSPTLASLAEAFGDGILTPSGELDRKKLAERAFANPQGVETLNRLTHPPIITALKEKLEGLRASGYDGIVAVEAALLVEQKASRCLIDVLVAVTCHDSTRKSRLSHLGDDQAAALLRRRDSQFSDAGKAEQADYAIANDGTLDDLEGRAGELWEWLKGVKEGLAGNSV
jgi:dephospho-CoA kinase